MPRATLITVEKVRSIITSLFGCIKVNSLVFFVFLGFILVLVRVIKVQVSGVKCGFCWVNRVAALDFH